MERNHIIGFVLIFAILMLWSEFFFKPSMVEKANEKRFADSMALVKTVNPAEQIKDTPSVLNSTDTIRTTDSTAQVVVPEKEIYLKNSLAEFTFSNKGGSIKRVKLNNYHKIKVGENHKEEKIDLYLLEDAKNKFDYEISGNQGKIHTSTLNFDVIQNTDTKLTLTAQLPGGGAFTQDYILSADNYNLNYSIRLEGLNNNNDVVLYWENYLDKLEKNYEYEKFYTSIYYKAKETNSDYCSCRKDDKKELSGKPIEWFSHSNQFFNSSLIPKTGFKQGTFETVMLPENSDDLKLLKSTVAIPFNDLNAKNFEMQFYIGPNEYPRLKAYNNNLQDIIPYGWSIFGTINRYLILPLFLFLKNFFGSMGLIILLMTLIVKLFVFPLAYKMLKSQAKMAALKPEIEKLKSKHKDDAQQQQVETMKMYNEFGVNPLGGCFPLLLQMPIWIALYRFFPATIDFRQASFLWAADLTSYDEFLYLPFSIPFFGNTLSLFAFLWVISTVIFTYYSSKTMDFSANPAMLYMQYLMPFIFWFMFNKTAAGLTCYMFFSNLLNIAQTIVGKNYLFDSDKIRDTLELNKSKPKKKGGFQAKLETMMKEQQRIQQEKAKNKK